MQSKNYFQEKGQRAEAVIHNLATNTFLTDWCYPNPKKPDGNELCDLLVVFDDIAIIWQIKDLKVDKQGRYKKAHVRKNLRQLEGARRHLFDLKVPIELENARRGQEVFDASKMKTVHLISALMGGSDEPFDFMQVMKDKLIHVFTREFADLALRELDTVSDFCEYLRKKEAIDNRVRILLMGGEQNLLANYLHAGRSFDWTKDGDLIIIEDTNWDGFSQRPEYLAKKQEDEVSYGWDSIIDRAHDTPSERYERIARELARADRFMRRILAKDFLEAYVKYVKTRPPTFRRFLSVGDTTYCFLFMEDGQDRREHRQTLLQIMCFVAR